jgi:nicotinamide mononucleotide adenylyltransferase
MFIKYSIKSYKFPEVDAPVTCLPALENLELSAADGWKCAFLVNSFMTHKAGFLVVYRETESEKDEFYVEKTRVGKGKKLSKFRKVFKEDETDRLVPMPDDDANDKVVCYLDDKTRITSNSYCFKIQKLEKMKDEKVWKTAYFYSDLAWALKGYLKHAARDTKSSKARPTVKDLYNLVVDIYKRIEVSVAKL